MNNRRIAMALLALYLLKRRRKPKPWVERRRKRREYMQSLIECEDVADSMNGDTFNKILKLVKPHLKAKGLLKGTLRAEDCLVTTLLYLITGCEYKDLKNRTLICTQLIEKIIPTTLNAIIERKEHYMVPTTSEQWQKEADTFMECWQFKNCVASIGARHISIKEPIETERQQYLNPDGKYSCIWVTTVGANYQFLNFETGNACNSTGAELLKDACPYVDYRWTRPDPCVLPGTDISVPYVTVADGLWPLDNLCMTPYLGDNITEEERVYNYRLFRARHVVDNAIGVLTSKFQILNKDLDSGEVCTVVYACCVLHNFLLKNSSSYMSREDIDQEDVKNGKFVPGKWRENVKDKTVRRTYTTPWNNGEKIRNVLKEYFNTIDKLPFQDKMMYVVPCTEPVMPLDTEVKMDLNYLPEYLSDNEDFSFC